MNHFIGNKIGRQSNKHESNIWLRYAKDRDLILKLWWTGHGGRSHNIQQPLECTPEDNLPMPDVGSGVGIVASSDEEKGDIEGLQKICNLRLLCAERLFLETAI